MKHLKSDDQQQTQQTSNNNIQTGSHQEIIKGQLLGYDQSTAITNNIETFTNNQLTPNNYQLQQNANKLNNQNQQCSPSSRRGISQGYPSKSGGGMSTANEEEILSVEEIIVKELSSQSFYDRLNSQIKQYAQQFETQQQQFVNQMKQQMTEVEEMNQIKYDTCYQMIEVEQQKVNAQRLNISNAIDAQNDSLNTIQQCLQIIQQANLIFDSNIFHLNQFCTILSHLTIQDEKVKHQIGLFGFKDTLNDQNSGIIHQMNQQEHLKGSQNVKQKGRSIHLDEKCMSCSGQSIQINQLFKLACLAYKPQPIQLEGKQYSRIDLLQLCQKILNKMTLSPYTIESQQKLKKKTIRNSARLEEDKDNKMEMNNINDMEMTSKSIEASTHRLVTTNTLNQTIEQGYLSHRNSLQNNSNIEHESNSLNNPSGEQNLSTNYYQVAESKPRALLKSREFSNSTRDWSISDDKVKRLHSSVDSGQINLNNLSVAQIATSQMKVLTKHKVRKLVQNKQSQNSEQEINMNKTAISFQNSQKSQKASSFEKRRQFIMRQSITSFNNSSISN